LMFGKNLRAARLEKGYTLEHLANLYNSVFVGAGLSKGTLSKYENGKQEPMVSVVANLASVLNVSIDYLLNNKTPREPTEEEQNRIKLMNMLDQLSEEQRRVIENLIVLEWKQQQRE